MMASAAESLARAKASGPGPVKKAIGAAVVAAVAVVAFGAVLYARREAVFSPAPDLRAEWTGRVQAIVGAKRRVFAAWDSTGQLPRTLTEVGPPQPLIVYTPGDTGFVFAFQRVPGDTAYVTYTKANRYGTARRK